MGAQSSSQEFDPTTASESQVLAREAELERQEEALAEQERIYQSARNDMFFKSSVNMKRSEEFEAAEPQFGYEQLMRWTKLMYEITNIYGVSEQLINRHEAASEKLYNMNQKVLHYTAAKCSGRHPALDRMAWEQRALKLEFQKRSLALRYEKIKVPSLIVNCHARFLREYEEGLSKESVKICEILDGCQEATRAKEGQNQSFEKEVEKIEEQIEELLPAYNDIEIELTSNSPTDGSVLKEPSLPKTDAPQPQTAYSLSSILASGPSAPGYKWKDSYSENLNSGFADKHQTKVREGREEGATGLGAVGRTGRGDAKVPDGMVRALKSMRSGNDEEVEDLAGSESIEEWFSARGTEIEEEVKLKTD